MTKKTQNKLSNFIQSNLFDATTTFIVYFTFNIHSLFQYCSFYPSNSFDSQALLTWDYVAGKGLTPYKDFFYPYGLFILLKNLSFGWHLIYWVLTYILFLIIFYTLKSVYKDKILTYSSYIIFCIFVYKFIGLESFTRYGIIVAAICIFSLNFTKVQKPTLFFLTLTGLVTGIIFSTINDQGIYMGLLFILFLTLAPLLDDIQTAKQKNYYVTLLKSVTVFIISFIFGTLPFLIYLIKTHTIYDFLLSLIYIKDIALYAKTPFLPYSKSPENLFTFFAIVLTIVYCVIIFIKRKKTIGLNYYLQIGLIITLLFLEQKSLIRSIEGQITFIALLLYFILLSELTKHFDYLKLSKIKIYLFLLLSTLSIIFSAHLRYANEQLTSSIQHKAPIFDLLISSCKSKSENITFIENKYPAYKNVIKRLIDDNEFDNKVYSFPGEPIFYLILKQKPPYYFSTYESTPVYGQQIHIDYLRNNNIKFVIYNLNMPSIQDGVPNYARVNEELKYILNNYSIYDKVGNYLILKRTLKVYDIFADTRLQELSGFQNYLRNIDLASIPRSEGIYKMHNLKNLKQINHDHGNTLISKITSQNKLLILKPEKDSTKDYNVKIKSTDGLETTITFYKCNVGNACIIDLKNIPLFYINREIEEIRVNNNFIGEIEIKEYTPNGSPFW